MNRALFHPRFRPQNNEYTYSLGKYLEFASTDSHVSTAKQVLNAAEFFQIGFSVVNGKDKDLRFGESSGFGTGWYVYKLANNEIRVHLDGGGNRVATNSAYPDAEKVWIEFVDGAVSIYVDGDLAASTETGTIPAAVTGSAAGNFVIGHAINGNNSVSSNCGIDDLVIAFDDDVDGTKRTAFFAGESPLSTFSNVVSFYDFNDNLLDRGSLANHGTANDIDSEDYKEYFSLGKYLNCSQGDEFVQIDIADISALNGSNKASIHAIINVDVSDIAVIGVGLSVSSRFYLVKFSDNNLYFVIGNGANSFIVKSFVGYNNTDVLVSVVYDYTEAIAADRRKIYINGALITPDSTTGAAPSTLPTFATDFFINFYDQTDDVGVSTYDQIVITNGAPTAQEISDFYNGGNGADAETIFSNILAYYKCDQNNGDTILNDELSNADGAMNNFDSTNDFEAY